MPSLTTVGMLFDANEKKLAVRLFLLIAPPPPPPIHLKTEPIATTQSRPIEEALEQSYQDLVEKIDSFTRNGSGWVLKAILNVDIRVVKYNTLRGAAYLALSKKLRESKFILNIRSDDEKCALYCILARLFPKNKENCRKHISNNPRDYKEHIDKINTKYLSFPLLISVIGKLEKWNNLSINMFYSYFI